ncbi:MAG: heparinase II/III family protein [Cyclobacteriaceae bacterium]
MKSTIQTLALGLVLATAFTACQKVDDSGHPRILLLEGEENTIKNQIKSSESWGKMHQAIIDESNNLLSQEPPERKKVGRRLLGVSREYLRRVYFLSYAYRMTGDQRYADHAEKHMLKSASFSDWNPTHFLDVGEMTMALAIGYDWLYSELSEESRKTIREAIVELGIRPSYNDDYNWFLKAVHNWNQVCNAGMTYGALAVQEFYPELADSVINRAFETIPRAMHDYRPDGAYPEGYGYWGYGTTFNVMFISAVEKALGTDRGLSDSPGFLDSPKFMEHMVTPSGICYNWGDCGQRGGLQSAMFWFAERTNDPSILWSENLFLQTNDYSEFTRNRLLPSIMIWGKDIPVEQIAEPDSKFYIAQGKNPVCLMRNSWTDKNAMYLGFKAGSPSVNHGHMDIGSFIMESDGVRWVMDFGSQNYESLESKGMSIFGKEQNAQRWTIFRLNNYAHATLTINDSLQRVDGYAKMDTYSDNEEFMFATSDISSLYNGQLKKAVRGVGIKEGAYTVIRDEVETLGNSTKLRWNLVTPAEVSLTDKGAVLTKDGKTLNLIIKSSVDYKMKTWSTAPTNGYDAENPGTIMVGFESMLPANSTETFEVLLIPEDVDNASFTDQSLNNWK